MPLRAHDPSTYNLDPPPTFRPRLAIVPSVEPPASVELGRCPERSCAFRWRSGRDGWCADHAGDSQFRRADQMPLDSEGKRS